MFSLKSFYPPVPLKNSFNSFLKSSKYIPFWWHQSQSLYSVIWLDNVRSIKILISFVQKYFFLLEYFLIMFLILYYNFKTYNFSCFFLKKKMSLLRLTNEPMNSNKTVIGLGVLSVPGAVPCIEPPPVKRWDIHRIKEL